MNKKVKTALWITAGAGAALGGTALAAGALYTEVMTSVIARRKTRATRALMNAVSKQPEPTLDPALKELSDGLRRIPMEQVEIRSYDRYVLRGRWYPAENPRRTVILAHGWHSHWYVDFSASAPFLHENGCNLLLIDQRCHGDSGGDLIGYGVCERQDILAWLDWVEANHKGIPVYLCGLSMGAATVLMTAALPIGGRVAGIIADSAYAKPNEIIQRTLKKNIGPLAAPTLAAVNLNCKRRGNFTYADATPVKAMKKNKLVPCLFIHGDGDTFVPCEMSREIQRANPEGVTLRTFPDAAHALSYLVDPDGYEAEVRRFLQGLD